MAVLSRDDYISRVHDFIGEDSSDGAITFLEDMIDTYEDLSTRTEDTEEWEKRYKELDESWRKRYRHRFLTGHSIPDTDEDETEEYKPEEIEIEELFEEEE